LLAARKTPLFSEERAARNSESLLERMDGSGV
jgi:hypothetical protein